MKKTKLLIISISFLLAASLFANEADVVNVKINKGSDNRYSFDVTILHNDTGWNHYVNKWDIVDNNGVVLATRLLYHPHVNEQPFTRSLSRVKIPTHIKYVTIRAHDLVHKYGGKIMKVRLP